MELDRGLRPLFTKSVMYSVIEGQRAVQKSLLGSKNYSILFFANDFWCKISFLTSSSFFQRENVAATLILCVFRVVRC